MCLELTAMGGYVACICKQKATLKMATSNPIQFIQQVRAEISKVVWPTRREVVVTTIMVFIMASLAAIFFALIDLAIRGGLQVLLSYFA